MILYHGTTKKSADNIRTNGIDYQYGNDEADFGPGFYLTDDKEFAIKCAFRKVCNGLLEKPVLVSYNFDMKAAMASGMMMIYEKTDLAWGQFIINNRNGWKYVKAVEQTRNHNLFHNHPIVIGKTADGTIVRIAALLNGEKRLLKSEELSDIINIGYPRQISLHDKIAEQFFIGPKDETPRVTLIRR